jgi:hypothetical protein
MIESTIAYTLNAPGMSALARQFEREGVSDDPRFVRLGLMVFESMGIDLEAPDMERMARAFSALAGANFTARVAATLKLEPTLHEYIVAAAMAALGYREEDGMPTQEKQA